LATVTVRQHMKVALVVDEENLRALDKAIRDFVPGIRIEATTADGVVHAMDNIEELLQLPNSSDEAIIEFGWKGHDVKAKNTAIVNIDSSTFERNATFTFESPDGSKVRELKRQVVTWLRENRAAYGWIAERNMVMVVVMAWAVLYSGLWVWAKTNPQQPRATDEPLTLAQAIVVVTFWLLPIAGGWVLEKLKPFAFPVLALQTGHGKKRYQRASTVRNGVLLALVVGIVGSVIAAKLFP